jgi:hypothetical protein
MEILRQPISKKILLDVREINEDSNGKRTVYRSEARDLKKASRRRRHMS